MKASIRIGVMAMACSLGCSVDEVDRGFDGPGVEVRMAALELHDATDVVWDLEVETLDGSQVFAVRVTSARFGDGKGSASYVGPCVGGQDNRGHAWIRGVYTAASPLSVDPGGFGDDTPGHGDSLAGSAEFINPGRLTKTFPCQDNGDTFIAFDVVVMRPAAQGFVDIAVNFNQIYCSSKYDTGLLRMEGEDAVCEDNLLLHDPDASGARGPTHVLALACTAGVGSGRVTALYLDDVEITCADGATITIDPSAGEGNRRVGGTWAGVTFAGPGTLTDRIFQVAVYQGEESLAGLNKVYWNIAIGAKDLTGCGITSTASADDLDRPVAIGRNTPFTIDGGLVYPYIAYHVADIATCAAHPLDGATGVDTQYTLTHGDGLEFAYRHPTVGPTCTDGRLNGDETDVDCGGDCPPCQAGASCLVGGDCESDICDDGACLGASCFDGLQNGDESDVDCGGSCAAPCADGLRCEGIEDCAVSSVCWELFCRPETCFDAGGEPLVSQCGGTCPRCPDGEPCATADDCQSGVCAGDVCAAPTCSDGLRNGDETGVDCGGSCAPCPEVIAFTTGGESTCALLADQSAWCWGSNSAGKLGIGPSPSLWTPTPVVGLTDATMIRTAENSTCAVRQDKTAWCWGSGSYYKLGTTTTNNQNTPQQVVGNQVGTMLTGVDQIAPGQYSTCALREDGSVWCWGNNIHGQLGIGSTSSKPRPQQVKGPGGVGFLDQVVSIANAPKSRNPCALRSDGSAYCWGSNHDKQLGSAVSSNHSRVPARVGGSDGTELPAGVREIAPGTRFVCAWLLDDSVWCWGDRRLGVLGDGGPTSGNTATPVQVLGPGPSGVMSGVASIAAGDHHTCVVRTDGSLWCWGWNRSGALGDGTALDRSVPVQVVGFDAVGHLGPVILASAGHEHTCAILTDGAPTCWGRSSNGQLGYEADQSTSLIPHPVVW